MHSFSFWQSEDILSLLSPRSCGWDRPLSWGLKDVRSCVFAWCFVMLSVKHEFLSSWFGLMCSDCFVSGPRSLSCPLFSGLWNKERDVQLCQGLKSPQNSETLNGTQKDLVWDKTEQKTAPSFRGSRRKSNYWKWPQCHHNLSAAWGPFQSTPNRLPGAVLLS